MLESVEMTIIRIVVHDLPYRWRSGEFQEKQKQRSSCQNSTKAVPKLLKKVKLNGKKAESVHILNLLGV